MGLKDERLKLMNQMLSGIKVSFALFISEPNSLAADQQLIEFVLTRVIFTVGSTAFNCKLERLLLIV